jgi:hypothetical protein
MRSWAASGASGFDRLVRVAPRAGVLLAAFRRNRLSSRPAVEGEEAASVPSHPGDGAGDSGEAGEYLPIPFETLGDDCDAMQNAGVLANQCGSNTNWRVSSMAMRDMNPRTFAVWSLTVLPPSSLSGQSRSLQAEHFELLGPIVRQVGKAREAER